MHRARITLNLVTSMSEDGLEQWGHELLEEVKLHLVEGEAVELDIEIEAQSVKT